jgi:hypothetical protein
MIGKNTNIGRLKTQPLKQFFVSRKARKGVKTQRFFDAKERRKATKFF